MVGCPNSRRSAILLRAALHSHLQQWVFHDTSLAQPSEYVVLRILALTAHQREHYARKALVIARRLRRCPAYIVHFARRRRWRKRERNMMDVQDGATRRQELIEAMETTFLQELSRAGANVPARSSLTTALLRGLLWEKREDELLAHGQTSIETQVVKNSRRSALLQLVSQAWKVPKPEYDRIDAILAASTNDYIRGMQSNSMTPSGSEAMDMSGARQATSMSPPMGSSAEYEAYEALSTLSDVMAVDEPMQHTRHNSNTRWATGGKVGRAKDDRHAAVQYRDRDSPDSIAAVVFRSSPQLSSIKFNRTDSLSHAASRDHAMQNSGSPLSSAHSHGMGPLSTGGTGHGIGGSPHHPHMNPNVTHGAQSHSPQQITSPGFTSSPSRFQSTKSTHRLANSTHTSSGTSSKSSSGTVSSFTPKSAGLSSPRSPASSPSSGNGLFSATPGSSLGDTRTPFSFESQQPQSIQHQQQMQQQSIQQQLQQQQQLSISGLSSPSSSSNNSSSGSGLRFPLPIDLKTLIPGARESQGSPSSAHSLSSPSGSARSNSSYPEGIILSPVPLTPALSPNMFASSPNNTMGVGGSVLSNSLSSSAQALSPLSNSGLINNPGALTSSGTLSGSSISNSLANSMSVLQTLPSTQMMGHPAFGPSAEHVPVWVPRTNPLVPLILCPAVGPQGEQFYTYQPISYSDMALLVASATGGSPPLPNTSQAHR